MFSRRFALTLAAGATMALTAGTLVAMGAHAAIETGAKAPAFAVVDTAGKTRTLTEFAGKTVVLEWTNHDCPFVVKHYETGNMQKLQKAAAKDGVVWLSVISSAPGKQGHVTAAKANELTKTRNAAPAAVLLDESGAMGKAFGAKTTPHIFIVSPKGDVVYQGAIDDNPGRGKETVATAKNFVTAALADLKAGRAVAQPTTRQYGCTVKY
jgi:peroxiredoxin